MAFVLRADRRFPLFSPLTYERGFREGHGTVSNLSSIGWRISGHLLLQRGDVCALRVTLPTRQQIVVSAGIVRWVCGDECGIETLVMNAESQETLKDYLQERIKAL